MVAIAVSAYYFWTIQSVLFMGKGLFTAFVFLLVFQANAQLGVMKLVGNNTKDYSMGFGAFIKTGFPASEAADITFELSANIFPLQGYGNQYGTIMCPLITGYRYTLDRSGQGFYVEPQIGYNLVGITSLPIEGNDVDLKYHGVVFGAGTGYLFTIGNAPFDLNFRYETVIAHGGSNNLISLGISRFISFGKRESDY